MAQVVHARCPKCKQLLELPSDFLEKSFRCRHCGTAVRLRQKPSAAVKSSAEPPAGTNSEVPAQPTVRSTFAELTLPGPEPVLPKPEGQAPIISSPVAGARPRGFPVVGFVVGLLLLGAAVVAVSVYAPQIRQLVEENVPDRKPERTTIEPGPGSALPTAGIFPRRLLGIALHHYLYANPIGIGSPNRDLHGLLQRMARVLHVPATQSLELTDTSSVPPRKAVLEQTLRRFLETCRAQDRIILLFVGHLVMIDTEAYLVPLDGEVTVKETLLPWSWLSTQLAQCKACQKVLIVDSCRFDPTRGLERPGSGPMPAALDALLKQPPSGVQLVCSCTAGQCSYEFEGNGIFMEKLYEALTTSVLKNMQEPADPLPIDLLAQSVHDGTQRMAASLMPATDGEKAVQTPRLAGQMPEKGAAYDPDEPLPAPLEIALPAPPPGKWARPDEVESLVQEIELPPIRRPREGTVRVDIARLMPFSAETLARYQPDAGSPGVIAREPARYPLRAQVLQTVKLLRSTFDPRTGQAALREQFQGASNERIKAQIFQEQKKPAQALAELTERLDELRRAGEERDKEPSPRWQAHYDYVLAELLARIAYISEYDHLLGKIRKDELPELRPNVHTGWRLVSTETMQSPKEIKELAAEARKRFAKVIHDYPGTPWEVLAKRERLTALGLEWQPSS